MLYILKYYYNTLIVFCYLSAIYIIHLKHLSGNREILVLYFSNTIIFICKYLILASLYQYTINVNAQKRASVNGFHIIISICKQLDSQIFFLNYPIYVFALVKTHLLNWEYRLFPIVNNCHLQRVILPFCHKNLWKFCQIIQNLIIPHHLSSKFQKSNSQIV